MARKYANTAASEITKKRWVRPKVNDEKKCRKCKSCGKEINQQDSENYDDICWDCWDD